MHPAEQEQSAKTAGDPNSSWSRRAVLAGAACLASGTALAPSRAEGRRKVVVVGGGAGGATAAKHIAQGGKGMLEVTLVEQSAVYTSCALSNLRLADLRPAASLTAGYERLEARSIRVVHQKAVAVDRTRKTVTLGDGETLRYDRLILSPGVDLLYGSVPGYSEAAADSMPHAWTSGAQVERLKEMLDAVPDDGLVAIIAPPDPSRCPPAAYERASMMACALRSAGKTGARVVVVDVKPRFSAMALFFEAWEKHYPGMIEWQEPSIHGGLKGVDAQRRVVITDFGEQRADLVNVIPAQAAGEVARAAGLADSSGFCPIVAGDMRSTVDPNVFVIGDACIADEMPKSAFSANGHGRAAASSVLADLLGLAPGPAAFGGACWSLLTPDDAIKIDASYRPSEGRFKKTREVVSALDEPAEHRRRNVSDNEAWYAATMADAFG